MGANRFGILPVWLRNAWALKDSDLPQSLLDCPVAVTEDAGQGGWANGVWQHATQGQLGVFVGGRTVVIQPDRNKVRLVTEVLVIHNGGAADAVVTGETLFPNLSPSGAAFLSGVCPWEATVAPASHAVTSDVLTRGPVIVPPGWSYGVTIPALAAGEEVNLHHVWLESAAGYKVA